jgi:hypothetical protein
MDKATDLPGQQTNTSDDVIGQHFANADMHHLDIQQEGD